VCLWSMPSAFVGLSFSSSRQIAQLSKQRFGDEINATDLFKTLVEIDSILNSESAGPGSYFKEPTEDIYHDQLIREVRLNTEANIFKVFMKNYMSSLKENQLLGKTDNEETGQSVTHIQNKLTGTMYDIVDDKCTC
jgi:hypothetical protein